jgi:TP901 family phage tail tape measure protein
MPNGRSADILLTMGIDTRLLSQAVTRVRQALAPTNKSLRTMNKRLGLVGRDITQVDRKSRRNMLTMLRWGLGWTLAYTAIRRVQQALISIVQVFGEVETGMVNIRIVTRATEAEYRMMEETIFRVSKQFGANVADVIAGSTAWARQGRVMSEVMKLTETAMYGVNITGQSMSTVVSNLTAALKIYNINAEDSIQVMDKWIGVAARHAIEAGQLAEGMRRIGTMVREVGVSLDELHGYLTAVHVVTRRELSAIGTAFRTIFMRMARRSTLNLIQALADVPVYMKEGGVVTKELSDTFRDFSDILDDLALKWNTLSQAQKFSLAMQIAGIRRSEMFIALMSNYKEALIARIHSEASVGRAAQANALIMQTYEKQVRRLIAAFKEYQNALARTGLIDVLRGMVIGMTRLLEIFATNLAPTLREFTDTLEKTRAMRDYNKNLKILADEFVNLYPKLKDHTEMQDVLNEIIKEYNILADDQHIVTNDLAKANEQFSNATKKLVDRIRELNLEVARLEWTEQNKVVVKLEARLRKVRAEYERLPSLFVEGGKKRLQAVLLEKEMAIIQDELLIQRRDLAKLTLIIVKGVEDEADKGGKVTEGTEERVALLKLEVQHRVAIGRLLGLHGIQLAAMTINLKEQNGLYETQAERLRDLQAYHQAIAAEVYKLADALKSEVEQSLFRIIKRTGDFREMLVNIGDVLLKAQIGDILGIFEQRFGVFKGLSRVMKSPIARAHIEGIEAGVRIIENAHISGISKGMAGVGAGGAGVIGVGGGIPSIGDIGRVFGMKPEDFAGGLPGAPWFKPGKAAAGRYIRGQRLEALTGLAGAGMTGYGIGGWGGVAGGILGAIGGASMVTATMSAAMSALLPGVGTIIGAIIGGSLTGAFEKEQQTIREQTSRVTSRIEITNKRLEVVNRNLSAIRERLDPYPLSASAYFASDQARGWMG